MIDRELLFGNPEIAGAQSSPDGKFILFVNDKGGNENFNLYAVNPNEQPPSGAEVPVAHP